MMLVARLLENFQLSSKTNVWNCAQHTSKDIIEMNIHNGFFYVRLWPEITEGYDLTMQHFYTIQLNGVLKPISSRIVNSFNLNYDNNVWY